MTLSDADSPLGMAQEVERLLKMPQSLCKQRGICCRVATFKGSLSLDAILALGASEAPDAEHARVFASIFEPYPSQDAVRAVASEFVDRVREKAATGGKDPDAVAFFKCRFVLDDGRCGVHEDRPTGCRAYPFPHKNTVFHPGCGFEAQAAQNWAKIEGILHALGVDPDALMGDTSES